MWLLVKMKVFNKDSGWGVLMEDLLKRQDGLEEQHQALGATSAGSFGAGFNG